MSASGNAPSIGAVGVTADQTNARVKVLGSCVFTSTTDAKAFLTEGVTSDRNAVRLLTGSRTRFTARVLVESGLACAPLELCGRAIREEARIRTPYKCDVVYLGGNTTARTDTFGVSRECALVEDALGTFKKIMQHPSLLKTPPRVCARPIVCVDGY